MGMYSSDAPAVERRDPAAEASSTLLAQMEMERGTGKFADVGPRINIEREYRPQYTQLDNDMARAALYGTQGNNGMLALMAESGPELARINQAALSTQRAGDLADVSALAGSARTAYDQLNPEGAAMLKRINALRMEELENPYAMSASQRRGAEQNVRGAQGVRGMGMGPTDAFQEAMYLGDRQRGLYNERLQGAGQTIGMNQAFYGDPFQQILGRASGSSAQGLYQQAASVGPDQVFDPYSSYFGNAYGFNANAQNASNIAQANNKAAITGAMLGAAGQLGGATMTAGAGAGGFMRCWVAREIFGQTNPEWLRFRTWLETRAPQWFFRLYNAHGERFAAWVADKPILKRGLRRWMRARIAGLNSQNFVLP